jgi:hypothetical protein
MIYNNSSIQTRHVHAVMVWQAAAALLQAWQNH